jgi:hypothetical protein
LTDALRSVFGADIISLHFVEQCAFDSANVLLSVPGAIGGDLVNATADVFGTAVVRGRRISATGAAAGLKSLILADGIVAKSVWVVCRCNSPPNYAYESVVYSANLNETPLVRDVLTNQWYTTGGWNHYCDGVASETIPASGIHIFEGEKAGPSDGGIQALGATTYNAATVFNVALIMRLTTQSLAARRAAGLVPMLQYFGGP